MKSKPPISRRQFLVAAVATLGGLALAWMRSLMRMEKVQAQGPAEASVIYFPHVAKAPIPTPRPNIGRVIHVRSNSATHWNGEREYWLHVDQGVVNNMVNRGLMELTGALTIADAWRALLPNYQSGQKIAIKVNFNNTSDCNPTGASAIDALIEPVNAVVSGLEQIGVARADVCVYDAIRALPERFVSRGLSGVSYYDGSYRGVCRLPAGFSHTPSAHLSFFPPPGVTIPDTYVSDVLMSATYLINMPIMKGGHDLAGVTLGFKNHFGTIDNPSGLHTGVDVVHKPSGYRTDYNPMVDYMQSSLIGGKTILTIGDALFGARIWTQPPVLWTTFGNRVPNSFFFARDFVAVDCVMHDFVAAEPGTGVPSGANNYLLLASNVGLGVFENKNPWTQSYALIDYRRIDL